MGSAAVSAGRIAASAGATTGGGSTAGAASAGGALAGGAPSAGDVLVGGVLAGGVLAGAPELGGVFAGGASAAGDVACGACGVGSWARERDSVGHADAASTPSSSAAPARCLVWEDTGTTTGCGMAPRYRVSAALAQGAASRPSASPERAATPLRVPGTLAD